MILDELILRQDSIETARTLAFEQRFETMTRLLRNDIKHTIKAGSTPVTVPRHSQFAENNVDKEALDRMIGATKPRINNTIVRAPQQQPMAQQINVTAVPTRINTVIPTGTTPIETPSTVANNGNVTVKTVSKPNKKYNDLPIKRLDQNNIVGVNSGYYVIANVYKTKKYLNAFMNDLKAKGIPAKKFYNKENGLYYVYLADYNVKAEAENAYTSNLEGKYQDEKWIMQIDNAMAMASIEYDD